MQNLPDTKDDHEQTDRRGADQQRPGAAVHLHRGKVRHGLARGLNGAHQQARLMTLSISPGWEKITAARSPSMPAGMIVGAPGFGPRAPESVSKRRLRSQNSAVMPSAVVTRYVSPQS